MNKYAWFPANLFKKTIRGTKIIVFATADVSQPLLGLPKIFKKVS